MCKNCHGTVALNPLVGWFVKGASPHRKVHSMLGFSNVGMLALLKDTAVNQTCRKTGREKECNKCAITYRSKQNPFVNSVYNLNLKKHDCDELSIISA